MKQQYYSFNKLLQKMSTYHIAARASLLHALFFVFLLAFHCNASDRSPMPIEVDTRPDDVLVKAAQNEMLVGKWFSFKEGLLPIIISKTHISFHPGCKTTYSIVQSSVGKTHPDNHFPPLEIGRFVTVKMKLSTEKCMADIGFIQFSFMTTDPDYSFATVVEYNTHNQPMAWYDLRKQLQNKR